MKVSLHLTEEQKAAAPDFEKRLKRFQRCVDGRRETSFKSASMKRATFGRIENSASPSSISKGRMWSGSTGSRCSHAAASGAKFRP